MPKSLLSTRVFWGLIALCAISLLVRANIWGLDPGDLGAEDLYAYEQSFNMLAAPGDFNLSAYVPEASSRLRLIDERLEAGPFALDLDTDSHGRVLHVRGPGVNARQTVRYAATLSLQAVDYELDAALSWDAFRGGDPAHLAPEEAIQSDDPRVHTRLGEILGLVPDEDTLPTSADSWRRALEESRIAPTDALRALYEHCLREIQPAAFSGTTDALTALSLGEASCGGKSRLLVALARNLGIPSRVVGGVILGDGERKRTSHVWVECRIAGEWVPFDPLNDHFASLPDNYLLLYRGDAPLIQFTRGLAFDYAFASRLERVPRAWLEESLAAQDPEEVSARRSIPLLRRQQFSLILLAPFALLFAVFCRQVIGVASMGVFLPVLLGFSITQTGWLVGGGQMLLAIGLGVALRFLLSRLGLLHVPRNAVMITLLVLIFLGFSLALERMGLVSGAGSMVLPLAALAMTAERYTVAAMDKGHGSAFVLLLQTFALAVACYLILSSSFFKIVTVSFPEIFLLVIAEIVMIGSYRGLRWRELWRFRQVEGGTP